MQEDIIRQSDYHCQTGVAVMHMSMTASSSTARYSPRIPTELLARIFRFVCGEAVCHEYVPFSGFHLPADLSVKLAIVLVCKRWKAIATEFLYEDVNISAQCFEGLLEVLDRIEPYGVKPNGRYVRRLTFTSTRVDMDVAVLKLCPNVEILVKPMILAQDETPFYAFPFPDRTITTFGSVKRVEWSFRAYRQSPIYCPFQRCVDRSLAFFSHLIQITPNLRDLSLIGLINSDSFTNHSSLFSDLHLHLSRLRVLRVRDTNMATKQSIEQWNLPTLTHLVADNLISGSPHIFSLSNFFPVQP